jgi:hypothetical protein
MAQSWDFRLRYYLTFETEILACGGSQTKIYRALVRCRRPPKYDVNFSMLSMREYKNDKGKGITFKGE